VTGGYTYQDFRPKNKSNYNFENNNTTVESFIPTRYNLQSFFARTNLTIADKYIVTASFRRMVPRFTRFIDGVISQLLR
jgi:iron complex outermembrane receptor protein